MKRNNLICVKQILWYIKCAVGAAFFGNLPSVSWDACDALAAADFASADTRSVT